MNIIARLEKEKNFWLLLILSFLFFLLRFPSLFEPYWYGDEGIYEVLGFGMRNGRLLYRDIWDNKPPLLYVVYALFNGDQFWVKLASLLVGICTVIAFYFLAKKLFSLEKNFATQISTILFAVLFGLPLIEGNIANAENFMLLPIIIAGIIVFAIHDKHILPNTPKPLLRKVETKEEALLSIAGFLLGIAFLFKIVGIFDMAAFTFFLFLMYAPNTIKQLKKIVATVAKHLLFFFVGFLFPILFVFLFFLIVGGLLGFLKATFTTNIGYVGYANQFLIPQGFLILKLILLGIYTYILFLKKQQLTKPVLFILLWLGFSFFNAFFSGRPYTHYVLVTLPSFCLLVGLLFWSNKQRAFFGILLLIALSLLNNNFNYYKKILPYYQNFISYINNEKNTLAYQGFFDKNTPHDYALAQFLRQHTTKNDTLFIWGNNAQVYKLTNTLPPGRYTVAYHIVGNEQAEKETKDALNKSMPKYIVVMNYQQTVPYIPSSYNIKYSLERAKLYERNF